jgi:outer membrane protein TolC
MKICLFICFVFVFAVSFASAQTPETVPQLQLVQPQGATAPPPVITLQDALSRARQVDVGYQAAMTDVAVATEDRFQAKVARRPSVSHLTEYLGTQGNGRTPNGRYVTTDGVHVYRSWGIVHQDLTPDLFFNNTYRRAEALEALAAARVEIAQRGLAVTVTRDYYALVTSQRKYVTAQQSLQQSQRFLQISQQQEQAGQVAHSDVVKAQLQAQQQQQNLQEAVLSMGQTRLNLAVLLFPDLNENFTVVDDLDSEMILPPFPDIQALGERQNPDLRVAQQTLRGATQDVHIARNALLPSIAIDGNYGIEANAFALHSRAAAFPQEGELPNLGYYVDAKFLLPIFDWGARRSKVRQAEFKEREAQFVLTQTQKQLIANLYLFYNEALTARAAVLGLRRAADLAAESLRLINLRYQAGESTALEVVDAQNALIQARNAYDDAQTRYRVGITTLQSVTGPF